MPTEIEWDVVEEASMESFPASDPPGWIRSHATTSAPEERPPETSMTSGPQTRAIKRTLLAFLAAGLVVTAAIVIYRRLA